MAEIIHLIKVRRDTSGNLKPVDYNNCPFFKSKGAYSVCEDKRLNYCEGIVENNLIKEIDVIKLHYLIECRYISKNKEE